MSQPLPIEDELDIVELRIPCKAEWVAVARLAIAAIANRMHFTIEEVEDIKLAVAEACTNAIQHAIGADYITIRSESGPSELRIHVSDNGKGTRPEQLTARSLEEPQAGGLGVFLIRSLMDEVDYDVRPDRGTDLVMVKRFHL